jgi:hypothetical protein
MQLCHLIRCIYFWELLIMLFNLIKLFYFLSIIYSKLWGVNC